jgi:hypothetical protein
MANFAPPSYAESQYAAQPQYIQHQQPLQQQQQIIPTLYISKDSSAPPPAVPATVGWCDQDGYNEWALRPCSCQNYFEAGWFCAQPKQYCCFHNCFCCILIHSLSMLRAQGSCQSCLYVCCCPCCAHFSYRSALRRKYNIKGSDCKDCMCVCCLPYFAAKQAFIEHTLHAPPHDIYMCD